MPKNVGPLEPGKIYHIWTHANGKDNLFRNDENYRFFLNKYLFYINPFVDTFAYCLMPNHLHLMVRIKKMEQLEKRVQKKDLTGLDNMSGLISKQFSNLFNSYSKAYNKTFNRRGSLFQRPFKRKYIQSRKYSTLLIAYIHYNPVHHGFVKSPEDWIYSSLHAYLFDRRTNLNTVEPGIWFGNKEKFIQMHKNLNFNQLIPILEE